MTTLFLVRHGAHVLQGRVLVGRAPGVALSADGQRQAQALAERLAGEQVSAIYSSPLERAQATAAPIADRVGVPVILTEAITEIDFGEWTNTAFESLDDSRRWRRFNSFRSGTTPPGGESMLEAQARIVAMIERLRGNYPDGRIVLVSHGDVIKGALAYYLGISLDLFHRIEVDPGSLSILQISEDGPRILRMNEIAGAL